MTDWSATWRDQVSERDARAIEKAEVHLGDLADRWVRLQSMVAAGGTGESVGRSMPGPRVPVRADVIDLQGEIAAWAARMASLAAGALRAGGSNICSTVGRLVYIQSNISSIWVEDPATGREIADGAGRLRWKCRFAAGEVARAFPIDVECPECGCMALWAHPGLGLVRCGMQECGAEWMAEAMAVSVWDSDSATSRD